MYFLEHHTNGILQKQIVSLCFRTLEIERVKKCMCFFVCLFAWIVADLGLYLSWMTLRNKIKKVRRDGGPTSEDDQQEEEGGRGHSVLGRAIGWVPLPASRSLLDTSE